MEAARTATIDDLPRVVDLVASLVAELEPTRGGDVWSRREAPPTPYREHYSAVLEAADQDLVVGTIDGAIVGFGCVRAVTLRDESLLGVVSELFVELGAREVGVGEAIIGIVAQWCREVGCFGIDARALPGNRQAKNFFETHGFVARSLTMHHRFDL